MYIANIEYPGTWIKLEDSTKAFELNRLLSFMEDHVADMAVTLTKFEESRRSSANRDHENKWEIDHKLYLDVENNYKQQLPAGENIYQDNDFHRNQIEKLVREAKLKQGVIPKSYEHRFASIYAHSFMSSADSFSKFLNVLAIESGLLEITTLIDEFNTNLPALKKVRNSAQHSEDRTRGYGKPADVRNKKKMDLKPVDNNIINSDSGILILNFLNGNRLGYTIDDGSYQEVEINANTLAYIAEVFQKVLNSFEWHGPMQLKPHL